jgi:long-chain acyl-CoA synthetase
MRNGWFYTGDMFRRDGDGYFYFASRKSGMMKVAGLKVFPVEIEDVLASHPDIDEVVVLKGQDGMHGEAPRAVIVPKAGKAIERKEIRRFCDGRLARYKIPREIEFRDNLPKTAGGKVVVNKL